MGDSGYKMKKTSPTAYMLAFKTKRVNMDSGRMESDAKGVMKPIFKKVLVEYRVPCPWNPDIDMLSDECMMCESCKRHGTDKNYPSFSVVCQKQIDGVPVPSACKKRSKEIIAKRIAKDMPAAFERFIKGQDADDEGKKKKKFEGHLGKEKGNKVTDVLIPAGDLQNAQ